MIGGVVAILLVVGFFVLGPGMDFFNGKDPETAEATGEGEKAPAVGGLNIELSPADAVVKVDGKEYPGDSPRVVGELSMASTTSRSVARTSFLPFSQEVTSARVRRCRWRSSSRCGRSP